MKGGRDHDSCYVILHDKVMEERGKQDGVIRLSVGKLLVNLLRVVKRTNTPQIPQQMASSAGQKENCYDRRAPLFF